MDVLVALLISLTVGAAVGYVAGYVAWTLFARGEIRRHPECAEDLPAVARAFWAPWRS